VSGSPGERLQRQDGVLYTAAIGTLDMPPARGELAPGETVMNIDGPHEMIGPEHAFRDGRTLCGLGRDDVRLMRHFWSPASEHACRTCLDAFPARSTHEHL